jgi:hypothetical protein
MTGKCLSRRRSIPSNSISARNDVLLKRISNFLSLFHAKAYNFQIYTKEAASITVCCVSRSNLKKRFKQNG